MSIFGFAETYEEAWKSIIMPPRQEYSTSNLGATLFNAKSSRVQRLDFQLHNKKGNLLECSFYQHVNMTSPYPCIVYLHGNGCSRLESLQYTNLVLGNEVSFFTFDFSGCGRSGGRYSSVGWFEQDDLECVLEYLYNTRKVSKICLWGRSMGATTALLYTAKHPEIEYLILDSPFANFKKLIKEMAQKKTFLPGFLTSSAFNVLRETILKKAHFDIDDLRPIDCIHKVKATALFGVGKNDEFVSPQHTKDLYEAYRGPKNIEIFHGDHNSGRPIEWLGAVMNYIKTNVLGSRRDQQSKLSGLDTKSFRDVVTNPGHHLEPSPLLFETSTMRFTWLEPNSSSPTTRSLSCKKTNDKPSSENKFVEEIRYNKNTIADYTRQRGYTASVAHSRVNEETSYSPRKNPSFQISSARVEPVEDLGIERTITPQKVWQHESSKTTLGPKLSTVESHVAKAKETKGPYGLRKAYTTKDAVLNETASSTFKGQLQIGAPLDPYNLINTFNRQDNQSHRVIVKDSKETIPSENSYQHSSSYVNDVTVHSNLAAPIGFSLESPRHVISTQKPPGHKKRNNYSVSFAPEQFKVTEMERDSPRKKHSVERDNIDRSRRANNFSPQNKKIQIRIDATSPIFNPLKNAVTSPYNNYLRPRYVNPSSHQTPEENSQHSSFINPTMLSQTTSAFSSFLGNHGNEYLNSNEDKAKPTMVNEEHTFNRRLSTGTTQSSLASK